MVTLERWPIRAEHLLLLTGILVEQVPLNVTATLAILSSRSCRRYIGTYSGSQVPTSPGVTSPQDGCPQDEVLTDNSIDKSFGAVWPASQTMQSCLHMPALFVRGANLRRWLLI